MQWDSDALQYSKDSLACIFPDSSYSVRLVVRLLVAVIKLVASLNENENYNFTGIQDSTTIVNFSSQRQLMQSLNLSLSEHCAVMKEEVFVCVWDLKLQCTHFQRLSTTKVSLFRIFWEY